jgi:transcriptional regulator with XRE-family HTH domain
MGIYAVTSSGMGAAVERLGELLVGLGARLRFLRNQQGWTLDQLSRRTDLSEPFLSRLESGRRQPSLAALLTLARAYSMPLAALLGDAPPAVPSRVVIRAGNSSDHHTNGLQYRAVSGSDPKANLHAIHVTIPPKRDHEDFYRHDGEEWLYVLSGQLRLIFEDGEHLLKPGDSAHFEALTPHRLATAGSRAAEAIIVSCAVPRATDLSPAGMVRTSKVRSNADGWHGRLTAIAGHANLPTPPKGTR